MFKDAARISRALLLLVPIVGSGLAFQRIADEPRVKIEPRRSLAPSPELAPAPHADLRVDSSLVLIPVHVTTEFGASIVDLEKNDFKLFEDGIEQKISVFAKDDAPISIGILFDSSGSMHNKMKKSLEAAATFFETANADDEFFLVDFNDRPKLAVPFTKDTHEIYDRIARIRPFGCTSLYDAIEVALKQMKSAKNSRKVILLLSDGADNRSRHSFREIRNNLAESEVLLYAIGIFEPNMNKVSPEEREGPRLLDELTEQSGGRHYPVSDLESLPEISAKIGTEMRTQYVLGYNPPVEARDGKFHRVNVRLAEPALPRLRVLYRRGYYAPSE
ncbi:MAG: VWA domain-containing protein [Bryobacteraceae bacterium]